MKSILWILVFSMFLTSCATPGAMVGLTDDVVPSAVAYSGQTQVSKVSVTRSGAHCPETGYVGPKSGHTMRDFTIRIDHKTGITAYEYFGQIITTTLGTNAITVIFTDEAQVNYVICLTGKKYQLYYLTQGEVNPVNFKDTELPLVNQYLIQKYQAFYCIDDGCNTLLGYHQEQYIRSGEPFGCPKAVDMVYTASKYGFTTIHIYVLPKTCEIHNVPLK